MVEAMESSLPYITAYAVLRVSISGLWYLGYAIAQATGVSDETYPAGDYVVSGALFTGLGAILLLGAPIVVRIAYRKR